MTDLGHARGRSGTNTLILQNEESRKGAGKVCKNEAVKTSDCREGRRSRCAVCNEEQNWLYSINQIPITGKLQSL